nr:hypothetical protein [Candidatus Sigynarchaeota archaeon]
MVNFTQIPPDLKWDKKVIKLTNEYNDLVKKFLGKPDKKNEMKIREHVVKIEDAIITEVNDKVKRDYAFMIQLIQERHPDEDIFTAEVLTLQEHMLGRGTSDAELLFKEPGSAGGSPTRAQTQQPFDIQTIDLTKIDLINLEKIDVDQLEKSNQKCAFGDGEILDEHGNADGEIWRCKGCKTVYHENCVRVCLLMKGSCQVCDVAFLRPQK